MLNSKAQASFELLLLVAFVFVLSIAIGAYFFQESDASKIESSAKSIALRALSKESEFYFINYVSFDRVANSCIVCLSPSGISDSSAGAIAEAIKAETKISGLAVSVESTDETIREC